MNISIPDLTIAIPTYRRPKYLRQAIDSAIRQNDSDLSYEVIVVNNDSESDMSEIKEDYLTYPNIHFYTNEHNLGMLGNMNRCISLAKGKYIAFLHDDDILLPNYLSEITGIVQNGRIVCVIPVRYLLFDGGSRSKGEENRTFVKQILCALMLPRYINRRRLTPIRVKDNVFAWQNCYCAPSCGVLFRVDVLKRMGLFLNTSTYTWDYFSFLALNEQENIQILHKPVAIYRMATGASMRPEVQLEFFMNNEELMQKLSCDTKEGRFIRSYQKEIRWMNFMYLSDEARKLVLCSFKDHEIDEPPKWRFYWFMLRRVLYFSFHNLDVSKHFSLKARRLLLQMELSRKD